MELAFLDAYAAGVFVATSAGNEGPGAATAEHLSRWVTTVAASTQTREFGSDLTLTAGNGDTFQAHGVSIGTGVASPLPVVLASEAPYNDVGLRHRRPGRDLRREDRRLPARPRAACSGPSTPSRAAPRG